MLAFKLCVLCGEETGKLNRKATVEQLLIKSLEQDSPHPHSALYVA